MRLQLYWDTKRFKVFSLRDQRPQDDYRKNEPDGEKQKGLDDPRAAMICGKSDEFKREDDTGSRQRH